MQTLVRQTADERDEKRKQRTADLRMKLGSKGVDDGLPITVRSKAPSLRTTYAMLAIQLYVQRIVYMTARTDGNTNAVVERRIAVTGCRVRWRHFGFV